MHLIAVNDNAASPNSMTIRMMSGDDKKVRILPSITFKNKVTYACNAGNHLNFIFEL